MNFIKKTNLAKPIVVTILILFSTASLFGLLPFNAKAINTEVYVPEEDIHNKWQWNETVEVENILMYEIAYFKDNKTSQEGNWAIKSSFILNITSINNDTIDYGGQRLMSQINATELYYNCSSENLEAYQQEPFQIAAFQYNKSLGLEVFTINDRLPAPFILPFNSSLENDMNMLAKILNETFYGTSYKIGIASTSGIPLINKWDVIPTNPGIRTIRFENSTHGYFMEFRYLPNGTLEYGEMYFEQLQCDPDDENAINNLFIMNITLKRIYDPNPLSDIEWEVQPGDTLYFGHNVIDSEVQDYHEYKLDIIDKIEIMNDTMGFRLYGNENNPRWTCMSYVIANISEWVVNGGPNYYLIEENATIAIANNYYPFLLENNFPIFFTGINLDIEDLKFSINVAKFLEPSYPFNIIEVYEENGIVILSQIDTDDDDFSIIAINQSTGMIMLYYEIIYSESYYEIAFQKTQTIITNDNFITLKSFFGSDFKWNMSVSIDYSENVELYTALLPGNPTHIPLEEYNDFGDELVPFQFFLDIFSNNSGPFELCNVSYILSYDAELETLLKAKGYSDRDLRPFFYYEDEYVEWIPIENAYFDIDEVNNQIIGVFPNYSEYLSEFLYYEYPIYFTIGLSTSADIDFYLREGETLYFGGFSDNPADNGTVWEYRYDIGYVGVDYDLRNVNMTEVYDFFGYTFNGPGPEIQDFLSVYADINRWNNITKIWEYQDYLCIAVANNYFPNPPIEVITNYSIEMASVSLYPINTTGFDFVLTPLALEYYNGPSILEEDYIYISSTSYPGKYSELYFNKSTGLISSMTGWVPTILPSWSYVSQFSMNNESLLSGTDNIIKLKSDIVKDISVMLNMTPSQDGKLYYGLMSENPVNETFSEIPLFYLDLLVNGSIDLQNMTLYIQLPTSYNLAKMNIKVYAWIYDANIGKYRWSDELPPSYEWSDMITKDIMGNNITIFLPLPPGIEIDNLIAVVYTMPTESTPSDGNGDGAEAKEEPMIPGFNLYLLLGGIALISTVLLYKKKNYLVLK